MASLAFILVPTPDVYRTSNSETGDHLWPCIVSLAKGISILLGLHSFYFSLFPLFSFISLFLPLGLV